MAHIVCPWWLGYFLASPIRKFRQNPQNILSPYLKEGMIVLDIGSAMGFFTLPMARLVGDKGKVIAVDLQPKMINSLKRRANKAGLSERIETRTCTSDSLGIDDLAGKVDFALAFAVLHEFPAIPPAIASISQTLKPGGIILIAEPTGHVTGPKFDDTISVAIDAGLEMIDSPKIWRSHAAVFHKRA